MTGSGDGTSLGSETAAAHADASVTLGSNDLPPEPDHAHTARIATDRVIRRRARGRVAWLIAGSVGLVVIVALAMSRRFVQPGPVIEPAEFTITPPEGTETLRHENLNSAETRPNWSKGRD